MPLGEGWWLDLRTGQSVYIDEHASAVSSDPKRFRIDPKEIKGLNPFVQKDREEIVRLAMAREWARVRGHKGFVVVEFDRSDLEDSVLTIATFLKDQGFGDFTTVELHDIHRGKQYSDTLKNLIAEPERVIGRFEWKRVAALLKKLVD